MLKKLDISRKVCYSIRHMRGIESTENLYENTSGVIRKWGEVENLNAQPPVERITPEWIYRLARLSNTEAVLKAIVLEMPRSVDMSDRRVTLSYDDGEVGENSYTWPYIRDFEVYHVEQGKGKIVYLLWYNIIDENWYATYVYSYGLD